MTEVEAMSSLLRAREKNRREELRLSRWVFHLEVERKHSEQQLYNSMYEQKKIAYQLKQEMTNAKKRPGLLEIRQKREQRRKMLADKMNISSEVAEDMSEPELADNKKTNFPAIVKLVEKVQNGPKSRGRKTRLPSMPPLPTIEPKDQVQDPVPIVAETNAEGPDGQVEGCEKPEGEGADEQEVQDTPRVKHRRKLQSVVDRLFPKNPMSDRLRITVGESELAAMDDENNSETSPHPNFNDLMILSEFWVGDPKAIGSVRRPRVNPDIMGSREKSVGEIRRLLRDMPHYPSCSRNCNKPGAALESIASSMVAYTLPTLSKMKAKALSLDVLSTAKEGEETMNLPPIAYLRPDSAGPRSIQDRRRSMIKANKNLQEKLRLASQQNQFKQTDNVVLEKGKEARVQIGYTYDPTKKLKDDRRKRKTAEKKIITEAPEEIVI